MAREMNLIPPFKAGETLIIQRTVDKQNVLMFVVIENDDGMINMDANRLSLDARLDTWGVSSFADGRVMRQAESIDRLVTHLQAHCVDPECPHRGEVQSRDERPHSRACGIKYHQHGPMCSRNCPTCEGKSGLDAVLSAQ